MPLAKSRRTLPNINGNIKDLTLQDMNQFALGGVALKMETTEDAFLGERKIVLDEIGRDACVLITIFGKYFQKVAAIITKDLWFDD